MKNKVGRPKKKHEKFPKVEDFYDKFDTITREDSSSFEYVKTKFGRGGWANADKYKPIPYDVITLKTDLGREIPGWWADFFWDSLHLKPNEKVLKWKRRIYERLHE